MREHSSFYAGGEWIESDSSSSVSVVNPFDLSLVGRAPDGSAADVDRAVRAARLAFDRGPWPRLSPAERADWLEHLADALVARADEMAGLVTDEIGQPLAVSNVMSGRAPSGHLRYYAALIRNWEAEKQRDNVLFSGTSIVRKEPVGVAGLIVPWNYPQSLLAGKLAPALAVGCTVVIKPAAETPLDALLLAEIADSIGFPPGVINVVTGGRETGAALVAHPGVDKIGFTGSTDAGRKIAARCGERLIPVTLELGGKSAAIVLDDADPAVTLEALRGGSFMNSGQTCFLLSRLLVPEGQKQLYLDAVAELATSFVLGDPRDPSTDLGPLVSERIRERVRSMTDDARADGARIVVGGGDAPGFDGYFYQPTVVTDVDPASALAQHEVFGPVLSVFSYRDTDEAIRLANFSRYGLGGAVFSGDSDRAIAVARRVDTGTIGINGYNPDLAVPFGGYKESGIGRENGPEALENYLNTKAVYT